MTERPEPPTGSLSALRVRSTRGGRAACAVALALLFLVPWRAAAQLTQVDVGNLRLVYFEGSESYLALHAARAFLTSLEFQKRLLGFDPGDKVTVLLADFSDAGNAGAGAVPRNNLTIQIAPLGFAFETLAANERMTTIMNHELVHVATMDQAAGRDRLFRGLFRGKVAPVADQPETIAYFYLTAPRVAAPRWYHEGSAVFIDTWMAGGLGRAQSGYDEMVFRAMVRDGAHIYDPLGLASEGTKIDFQLQMNSYLYGARFMTYLARRYTPEKLVEWLTRHPGSRAYYSRQFRSVYGRPLEEAWAEWIEAEREFQQVNLAAIRTHPTTPYTDVSPRALGSVSRAFYDAPAKKVYAAFNYQGSVAHVGAISLATGEVEKLVDIKGPIGLHRHIHRLRSGGPHDFLHHRQQQLPGPGGRRRRDAPHDAAAKGRPDWRSRLQPRRPVPLGHPSPERHLHARAHSASLQGMEPRRVVPVRPGPLRSRRLAGRPARVGIVWRDQRPSVRPGLRGGDAPGRRRRAGPGVRLRRLDGAVEFHRSPPTAGTCTAAPISPGYRTSSATTPRRRAPKR